MEYFLDVDKPHWMTWCYVQTIDAWWVSFSLDEWVDAFPLYFASLGGFYDLAKHLVDKHPEYINARGGQMVTPLGAALYGKHFQVADLLHRHGADVNVRGYRGHTPLRAACEFEDWDIVQWLLDHRADVNTQSISFWTPLHSVAWFGPFKWSEC
jgi:ankyrin repeat protein